MSGADFSTAAQDLVTNDKPILVGSHAVAKAAPNAANMRFVTGNDLNGTTRTLAGFPTDLAYDFYNHTYTKGDTTSAATWYLSMDLGADATRVFDVLMVAGHNLGTIGGLTVSLEVGTSDAFSSVTEIFSTTPGTSNKRIVSVDLSDTSTPKQWTGEQFVRLKMTKGSGWSGPQIGQLWLGQRRHLPYNFDGSTQGSRIRSEVIRHSSLSGITTNYTHSKGQALREGALTLDTAADHTMVENWWEDTDYGAKPFLWIENPGTSPADCHVMTSVDTELTFEDNGPFSKELDLGMRESAPFLSGET